jgi:hypothetical protein
MKAPNADIKNLILGHLNLPLLFRDQKRYLLVISQWHFEFKEMSKNFAIYSEVLFMIVFSLMKKKSVTEPYDSKDKFNTFIL